MNALVTGGLGFIGSHIVDDLVREGHEVNVLDNLDFQVHQGSIPDYVNPAAHYFLGDILNKDLLIKALEGVDYIFHEAALVGMGQSMYHIHHYTDVNVGGTALLLDEIINNDLPIKKLIVAASMSSYGEGLYNCPSCGPIEPGIRPIEQMDKGEWEVKCQSCLNELEPLPTPESKSLDSLAIYSLNKKYQEELCMSIGKTYGIPVVSLRYFNVYGPRQSLSNPYTGVAAIFTSRIKNGNAPFIYEDGNQSRDFVHVEDVAGVNLHVMNTRNADYDCINVGVQNPISIKEMAEKLIDALGSNLTPVISQKGRPGDVRHCYADISRLKAIGYKLKYTSLNINTLIEWSKKTSAIDKFDLAEEELQEKLSSRGK